MAWPDLAAGTGVVLAGFGALAALELLARQRPAVRGQRWLFNLGLGLINGLMVRLIGVVGPLALAVWADTAGVGLLNWLSLPGWLAFVVTIILMDMAVYWQHRAFHAVPLLWRLHRLHHADRAMDVTTGVRFHPGEIALSFLWKAVVVVALGAPPEAVIVFEVLLTLASLWEHSDVRLPARMDGLLRHVIVTPAMHLVHHMDGPDDTERNFGFFLSVWDRWFGSYRAAPKGATIGLR
jgi:sterol desaturase/sphingolipid hydroxylase (fatty acid hydroxylase superfamily)